MMNRAESLLMVVLLAFLTACSNFPAPVGDMTAAARGYDDTTYCFNSLSIVTRDGLQGLMDSCGRELLPPEYDRVEFVSDDIALVSKAPDFWLVTRQGRFFAFSQDEEELCSTAQDRMERMLLEDVAYWDGVLDKLDSLCVLCLRAKGRKISRHPGIIDRYEDLKASLSRSRGSMTDAQRQRLASIEDKFRRYRK